MPITATYTPAAFTLTVTGTNLGETMTIDRDVAGLLRVNNGAVTVTGGPATVANTDLIEAAGGDGDDIITLDEANGALPDAELAGGNGNDSLTGGSGDDLLTGEANNDVLLGRGGFDELHGGADNDTLTGGDADDQMFGEAGNDRMIWNPGDDSDLMEGGDGSDTAEVNGGGGAEVFTVTANGTRVRFDRLDPAPFALDIGTTENLVLNANGGDDTISTTGNLAALIGLTLDGGTGNDTILAGNGSDTLLGGDGNDFIDGQQGNDIAFLGIGNDTFQWDPGDGSDTVEGQGDLDRLLFNASAANEILTLSANGARALFTRNVGAIAMDTNDLERFTINALAGTDSIIVNNVAGTDVTEVEINLAGTIGGTAGDAAADVVTANVTNGVDIVDIVGAGTSLSVAGLTATINITSSEGANDSLVVNGLGGDDTITATTLPAGISKLTLDGGGNNDTLRGSQGADTFLGGAGEDFVFGDNGNDVAFLGANNDVFEWNPGDGNDTVEGQDGLDELRFVGSNANESIDIVANGGRVLFLRDVANVTMDLDDVERISFRAIGGTDNITIGDLTGTDATQIDVRLTGPNGGTDGAVDTVTVNATNAADVFAVSSTGGVVTVSGLSAAVSISDPDFISDKLVLNGLGGDDVIDGTALQAGVMLLTFNGGLGADVFLGSASNDLVNGGDGNDTAFLGDGHDMFVWNPGDDNDIVEGQGGTDTLLFNASNAAETMTISANGGRVLFLRDVAAVTMDLNDTEVIQLQALGGADTITVNDLTGTDAALIGIDLGSAGVGDAAIDNVTLNASGAGNTIGLSLAAGTLTVTGLPTTVALTLAEAADLLRINAGGGNDSVSAATIPVSAVSLTLDGGEGNDILRSGGDGHYLGGIGNDIIFAGLTNSLEDLNGGDGIDTLDTTSWGGLYTINMVTGVTNYSGESFLNFENLITGAGEDTITGTAGANVIRTGAGIDNVSAGTGNDTVEGGSEGDTLDGGADIDTLDYSASNASVTVSLATNSAAGGHATGDTIANFENLTGSAFADTLSGNGAANVLNGGAGADSLDGAGGDDLYLVDNAGDAVTEGAGGGNDRVFASVTYVLGAGASVETLTTSNNAGTAAINLTGNALDNTIQGNDGANSLNGDDGVDMLVGRLGDDFYFVDVAGDRVVEAVGEGNDRVFARASYTLGVGVSVETLTTTNNSGTDAINLGGNELVNLITGNDGANSLNGGGGADTLAGRLGDDFYFVDDVGDRVVESAGQGADRVFASASYTLGAGVSVETMSTVLNTGTGAINLNGNELAQAMFGNDGANILDGKAGADTMIGRLGDDFFYVDTAADRAVETAGQGTDRVFTTTSFTLEAASSIEVLATTNNAGTTAMILNGNALAQTIYGNAGINILDGKGGNDLLVGLAGTDSFAFTTAPGAGNVDRIVDFSSVDDNIRLDDAVFAGIGPLGGLNPNAFVVGAAALDANDRIVYNNATGQLFFDADGNGAGAAVLFATLDGNPAVVAGDFVII